jgi:hypothetical protein
MGFRAKLSLLVTAMLIVGLLAGLAASASVGAGATAAKKKKKRCPAGTHKVVVKKKNGKKKRKCVPNPTTTTPVPTPVPTPAPGQTLTISPASFTFPDTQHHSGACVPAACPPQDFTVTNTGGAPSGTLATSIVDVADPVPGDDPAFNVTANTCGPPLPAGGTCVVTVQFIPNSNGGDGNYTAILHVIGSPGGDAQAGMGGHAL